MKAQCDEWGCDVHGGLWRLLWLTMDLQCCVFVISRVTDDRLLAPDNELGVVEEDLVPREVRDWLTVTFTRTAAANAPKRLADEKQLKFRSVAHAIRAGIVVDRLVNQYHS